MYKRCDEDRNKISTPAKRPKLDVQPKKNTEDVWGDDFGEAAIEEMDLIASQALSEYADSCPKVQLKKQSSFDNHYNKPSTSSKVPSSKVPSVSKENHSFIQVCDTSTKRIQRVSDKSRFEDKFSTFKNFEERLLNQKVHNSTFKTESSLVSVDKEIEKLKTEIEKLRSDFVTKDGETVFLRQQLQQVQMRTNNERLGRTRLMEEQANQHRLEINAICKEKESLQTQLELQTLQLGNLMERCKLLENKSLKLTEPCTANIETPSRNKHNALLNQSMSTSMMGGFKGKENSIQVNIYDKSSYSLKSFKINIPLSNIPKSIFLSPAAEKSIVDIRIIEKTGKRNLPILREEETWRIFENPDLVKPITTIIDKKELTTEFVLTDIIELERKTSLELESENSRFLINKLILAARELLLNTVVVLRTISLAMKNDDIRDMNDLYFSDVYGSPVFCKSSVCDPMVWHESERGIEARRIFGILSYVAPESFYLSKYLTGKMQLFLWADKNYEYYSKQTTRYNSWRKKGHEFEMLELLLEFTSLVDTVRRAHQFSGLIKAIVMMLCNAHRKVKFCDTGSQYIFQIFKNLVFSRPLSICYVPMVEILETFIDSPSFVEKLCRDRKVTAISLWKNALHFTPDACVLHVFIAQMENFHCDPITVINLTHSLTLFMHSALQTTIIPWKIDGSSSCCCCNKFLRFTIKILYKCSLINIDTDEWMRYSKSEARLNGKKCTLKGERSFCIFTKDMENVYTEQLKDPIFWKNLKVKQIGALEGGIKFLCYLAMCDPDFIIRSSDQTQIRDTFHLFMQNLNLFPELLKDNEEAMITIKSTLIFDKMAKSDSELQRTAKQSLQIKANFHDSPDVKPASGEQWKNSSKRDEKLFKSVAIFKALFKSKT
ncbi:uncharacterized protein [Prorops nasuta]|uniref:uncharacterized protein n=1 Tax=Prorops nasuta TaxID=863751 RepID=UPI0034CE5321